MAYRRLSSVRLVVPFLAGWVRSIPTGWFFNSGSTPGPQGGYLCLQHLPVLLCGATWVGGATLVGNACFRVIIHTGDEG